MTAKGHLVLNIPIATGSLFLLENYYLEYNLSRELIVVYIIATIFGSLLPDIDEPESYIGRKIPIFSNFLSIFISHRGITHYLCVPLFFLVIGIFQSNEFYSTLFIGLSIGILSHDIGDMLTKGGIIGFFFPILPNTKIVLLPNFLRFYTNSITEYFIIIIIITASIFFYTNNFYQIF
jgi:inner membrane protein